MKSWRGQRQQHRTRPVGEGKASATGEGNLMKPNSASLVTKERGSWLTCPRGMETESHNNGDISL